MTDICIPIPLNSAPSELESHFNEYLEALKDAMDLDLTHIDNRATVNDITITSIQYDGQGCMVEYEVFYSIYNGCKDMDIDDYVDGHIEGTIEDNEIVFKQFVPPPKRTTVDEF